MYIRRKIFSVLTDVDGEERLFSTTDYVYDERMYAEAGLALDKVGSNRGLGRSLILGNIGGAIGGYAGKAAANEAAARGKSDRETILAASGKGRKVGAIAGGAEGALIGTLAGVGGSKALKLVNGTTTRKALLESGVDAAGKKLTKKAKEDLIKQIKHGNRKANLIGGLAALGITGAGIAGGALGGHFGAKKNTQERLKKRAYLDRK